MGRIAYVALWGLGGLALLAAACVSALVWLTLPVGAVTASIPGLSALVETSLDGDGIARVAAANEADAAAAMGFLHARERLFQMDLMRRAMRGELSEIAGPATLRLDRLMRTMGVRQATEADLAELPAQVRMMLERYAAGVNAWIAARGRFAALEFAVLGAPRPWTPQDSLLWGKTMGVYLSGNWRVELARLSLAGHLTRAQIEALWPGVALAAPPAAVAPALAQSATRLAALLPRFPDPFTLPASASNEWAVDGTHSATGWPLLAGDPHLGYGLPGIWYLARIETPSGVLAGATAPGLPFLIMGHNGRIAWTFTNTGADVQDLFIETPAGDGYLTEQGPRPFAVREEVIHVRGAPDEVLRVRATRHGPVVSDLAETGAGGQILALSLANLMPGDGACAALLALNRAGSVAEAGALAGRMTAPVQNLLVADRHGIGLFVTGRVPLRKSGDGAFAARGDDGSQDWIGWALGADLPHVVAPSSGRLVNANERVATADFPTNLGRDWCGEDRARRIRAMLDASPKATAGDFSAMQNDSLDLAAADLLPLLQPLTGLLDGWDGRMGRAAGQPLIFVAWMEEFTRLLLAANQVPDSGLAAVAPWPDLVRHALSPAGAPLCHGDCQAMLRTSLDTALASLRRRFGPDPAAWRWGAAHEAVFAHPVLRAVPVLGPLIEARIAADGGDSTVNRGGVRDGSFEDVHGASFRGVYDLADLERSRFMVVPGQSGHPASRWARNFVPRWRDGESFTIPSRPASVAVRIRLLP